MRHQNHTELTTTICPCAVVAATMHGTVPYSIAEARDVLCCRSGRDSSGAAVTPSSSSAPVDVLAVVQDVIAPPSVAATPICKVYICDDSGDRSSNSNPQQQQQQQKHRSYVLFRGTRKKEEILETLRPGDIVRFNRVVLCSSNDEYPDGQGIGFVHSYRDPEAGMEFFCLGRVDELGRFTSTNTTPPQSMETDSDRVRALVAWCTSQTSSSSRAAQVQRTLLPSLPCQFRSLLELQSCQGQISHVVARIMQIELQYPPVLAGNQNKRTKKRPSTFFAAPSKEPSAVIVVLTDDGDGATVMTVELNLSNARHREFATVVHDAAKTKRPIRLSRVLSKTEERGGGAAAYHRESGGRRRPSDETILVLTPESSVTLATIDEESMLLVSTARDTEATQTQNLSLSLSQYQPTLPQEQCAQGVISRTARLVDISVHGVSLAQLVADIQSSEVAHSKLYALLQSGTSEGSSQPMFASAILTIGSDSGCNSINVEADGTIVQTLCGGLNMEELHSPQPHYGTIAVELLRGLLAERIELHWVLEVARCSSAPSETIYRAIAVSLPQL
jgi:hypothetical protein